MIGDNKLNLLLGDWQGEETLHKTAWTKAGIGQATLSFEPGPGNALVLRYRQSSGNETSLEGLGVISADGWWWFDSYGFTPQQAGSASWQEDELVLERSSARGRNVTRFAIEDDQLRQQIDIAAPAGSPLVPVMRGAYRRTTP
jgi:hypothetical protein